MKLRGAFIGFGQIAEKGHWPTYAVSPDAEIVAVMDPSTARQAVAKTLKPSLRIYNSVQELFRTENLDFVDICTPPSSHASLALKALEHGAHVLCEKPLTLKPAEYLDLVQATQRTGRTVFTVHNWKFAPIFQKAFSLIREGAIGPVWHVEIFTLRDNVCKGSATGAQSDDWRKSAAIAGGGILVDHGWHSFYLLMNLMNAEPKKILARMQKPNDDAESLEEEVQTIVQFPAASGFIHLTWRAPMRKNSVIIQGQAGTILIDDNRLLVTAQDGKREEHFFDSALSAGSHHADWFTSLLPHFIGEIRDSTKRGLNLLEAGWCLALTTAAYDSHAKDFKEIPVEFPRPHVRI